MKKEVWVVLFLLCMSLASAENLTLTDDDIDEIDSRIRLSEQRMRSFLLEQFNDIPSSGAGTQALQSSVRDIQQTAEDLQRNFTQFGEDLRTDLIADMDQRLRDTEDAIASTVQQEVAKIRDIAPTVKNVADDVKSATGKIIAITGSMLAISILTLVLVCMMVFKRIKPAKKPAEHELSPSQKYVQDARKAGGTDEQIRKQLEDSGYPSSEIDAAFR